MRLAWRNILEPYLPLVDIVCIPRLFLLVRGRHFRGCELLRTFGDGEHNFSALCDGWPASVHGLVLKSASAPQNTTLHHP
jgi:hypothetical protein